MHAAVYLRQSLDRTGEGQAVARQRKDCLALSKRRKWTPIEYVDNDRSATSGKVLPAYQWMPTDIRDGKVGPLVAWDLGRLHNHPRELEDLIDLFDEHRLALATQPAMWTRPPQRAGVPPNQRRGRPRRSGTQSGPPACRR